MVQGHTLVVNHGWEGRAFAAAPSSRCLVDLMAARVWGEGHDGRACRRAARCLVGRVTHSGGWHAGGALPARISTDLCNEGRCIALTIGGVCEPHWPCSSNSIALVSFLLPRVHFARLLLGSYGASGSPLAFFWKVQSFPKCPGRLHFQHDWVGFGPIFTGLFTPSGPVLSM